MSIVDLFIGFVLNLVLAFVIVRFVYYPARQNKDYVFTFLAFNTIVYFVMSLMTSVELSVGMGLGLFAIFSVLRYRTATMSTREMTYLFIFIALPMMNAMMARAGSWALFLGVDAILAAVLYVLEREWGFRYESARSVKYERIELIRPDQHDLLLADLRQRTGLPIKRVEVGRLNFLDDSAELTLFYDEPQQAPWPRNRGVYPGGVYAPTESN